MAERVTLGEIAKEFREATAEEVVSARASAADVWIWGVEGPIVTKYDGDDD